MQFAGGVFVGKNGVRRLYVGHFGRPFGEARDEPAHAFLQARMPEQDAIEIAPDRSTATARFHCTVQAEAAIAPGCPLVDMALQQGGGVIQWVEGGVFEQACVREGGVWKIRRLAYRAAPGASARFTTTYPGAPRRTRQAVDVMT